MRVNGKPQMWNISKTAARRAKRAKILRFVVLQCTYIGYFFDARLLAFGLGSFGALCNISDSTIVEILLLQKFSSDFNQDSYKVL